MTGLVPPATHRVGTVWHGMRERRYDVADHDALELTIVADRERNAVLDSAISMAAHRKPGFNKFEDALHLRSSLDESTRS